MKRAVITIILATLTGIAQAAADTSSYYGVTRSTTNARALMSIVGSIEVSTSVATKDDPAIILNGKQRRLTVADDDRVNVTTMSPTGFAGVGADLLRISSVAVNAVYPLGVSAGTYSNITLPAANVAAGTLGVAVVASSVPAGNVGQGTLGATVVCSSVPAGNVGPGTLAVSKALIGGQPAYSAILDVKGNISSTGQIISSGTGNNYFAGNVGIGNANPNKKLHVSSGIFLLDGTSPQIVVGDSLNNGIIDVRDSAAALTRIRASLSSYFGGNVGIGTATPIQKLEISSGTIHMAGTGTPAKGAALCLTTAGTLGTCTGGTFDACTCTAP